MAETAAARAVRLSADRLRRAQFFPSGIFYDHAWTILLWLFIENEQGRAATIDGAAAAAGIDLTSASRWIAVLRQRELVDGDDAIALTGQGLAAMRSYLETDG